MPTAAETTEGETARQKASGSDRRRRNTLPPGVSPIFRPGKGRQLDFDNAEGFYGHGGHSKTGLLRGLQVQPDAKVSADQRGHGLGVAMSEYTHSTLEQKLEAVGRLEEWLQVTPALHDGAPTVLPVRAERPQNTTEGR